MSCFNRNILLATAAFGEHFLVIELKHHHGGHARVSTAIWYPSGPSRSWYRDTYF
jgi:hypothetical protein